MSENAYSSTRVSWQHHADEGFSKYAPHVAHPFILAEVSNIKKGATPSEVVCE